MDKLLNLLNEYGKTLAKGTRIPAGNYKDIEKNKLLIISREYGFIKWLDKNKKIRWNTPLMSAIKDSFKPLFREWKMGGRKGEMIILMVLATSIDPINDLVKYILK